MRILRRLQLNVIARVSVGLASLSVAILLVADFTLGALPDRADNERAIRSLASESLASQIATLIKAGHRDLAEQTLADVVQEQPQILSAGLRTVDGELVAVAGPHEQTWRPPPTGHSTLTAVTVPLLSNGSQWGSLELSWAPLAATWFDWLKNPKVLVPLLLALPGLLLFYLYLRRVLQYLDPAATVPERVRAAYDALTEGVVLLDAKGRVVLANRAFEALCGSSELTGKRLERLECLRTTPAQGASAPWLQVLADSQPRAEQRLELRATANDVRAMVVSSSPILDARRALRGCLVVFLDRTEIERSNEQLRATLAALSDKNSFIANQNTELERLANTDPLSSLLNRRAFFERAGRVFASARQKKSPLAVIVLDIDHFKAINDTYGHQAGDQAIQAVAAIVQDCMRPQDLVCRYGGEEFAVMLDGIDGAKAAAVAERVRRRLEAETGRRVALEPPLRVTASIGVAALRDVHTSLDQLLAEADRLLYGAKRRGRNQVCVLDPDSGATVTTRSVKVLSESAVDQGLTAEVR